MTVMGLIVFAGLLGGLAVGVQQPLSSLLAEHLGTLEGVFIVQLGGAIAAGVILAIRRGGGLGAWQTMPWYALGAGVLGLVIIGAIAYTIPRVGVVATTFLVVTGQLIASTVIDHFGLFETTVRLLDVSRLLGIGLLFVALWLIVR